MKARVMETTKVVRGLDPSTQRVTWTGMPNVPAWHLVNARGHAFRDIAFHADSALLAAVLIESRAHQAGETISTDNRFQECVVQGYGRTRYGFAQGMLQAGDIVYPKWAMPNGEKEAENNEHMVFDQCSVFDTDVAAFANYGSQAKEQTWRDCKAGSAYGGHGLRIFGGGGQWLGGAMYGFDVCFYLGSPADPFQVIGGGFESFKRLLAAEGPRQDSYPVVLQGLRVMTDGCDPTGQVPMIDFRGPGPLTLVGGTYGGGVQPLPRITMTTWQQAPAVLNLLGVTFGAFGSWERRGEIVRYEGDGQLSVNEVGCGYADEAGAMHWPTSGM